MGKMYSAPPPQQDFLVRGLAHRLNNILTLFHGYVDLLQENGSLDRAAKSGLEKIKGGADAASDLIDRTHSLVRPSSIVWREIKLEELLLNLRPTLERFKQASTTLHVEAPAGLAQVRADLARLRTVVQELVRNACESIPASGGEVTVRLCGESTAPADHPNARLKWVSIIVEDTGPGIPEEYHPKIFQPFFTTKRMQNNAGLGLNMVVGLLQQIDGVLRYESRPGHTVFQVLLPAFTPVEALAIPA